MKVAKQFNNENNILNKQQQQKSFKKQIKRYIVMRIKTREYYNHPPFFVNFEHKDTCVIASRNSWFLLHLSKIIMNSIFSGKQFKLLCIQGKT